MEFKNIPNLLKKYVLMSKSKIRMIFYVFKRHYKYIKESQFEIQIEKMWMPAQFSHG